MIDKKNTTEEKTKSTEPNNNIAEFISKNIDEEKLETLELPLDFNSNFALKYIGYNTTNLENAIYSFKLRFNSGEVSKILSEKDKKILYLLMDEI